MTFWKAKITVFKWKHCKTKKIGKLPRNQSVFKKPFTCIDLVKLTKAKQKKIINLLIIIVNCIISAFQNVILHQIWSINKESRAI